MEDDSCIFDEKFNINIEINIVWILLSFNKIELVIYMRKSTMKILR